MSQRKYLTHRQARSWLSPMRKALSQLKAGEADAIKGYVVPRMRPDDSWARLDFCINGFIGLLERLMPDLDMGPAKRLSKRPDAGIMLTVQEIDAVFALLNRCETRLVGMAVATVKDAVMAEQICIEMEASGLKERAA